jgi:HEAT repeat protein
MQHDENVEVRAAAAVSLAHYVLMAEWGELPPTISPPIVDALLAEYEKAEAALPIKRAALEALGAANHPRVGSLIEEAYESDDFDMQISAVFAMGSSANSRWLPTILDEMGNPEATMRLEAARAAGAIGSSEAIDELANLTVDEDLDVRLTAVTALGRIGGDVAYRILVDLADDPESEELHEAVDEALEEMTWMSGDLKLMSLDDDDSLFDGDESIVGDELEN